MSYSVSQLVVHRRLIQIVYLKYCSLFINFKVKAARQKLRTFLCGVLRGGKMSRLLQVHVLTAQGEVQVSCRKLLVDAQI